MGRRSTLHKYIGKVIGGIRIVKPTGLVGGRMTVECLCLACDQPFTATFHNVYRGNYKSCGCKQFRSTASNPKWKGYGEISASYFYSLRRGARDRDLSFNISIKEVWNLFLAQGRKCKLSGVILNFSSSRVAADGTASLDRIDPKIGYESDNVQWVHKEINWMKQQLTNEEFIRWIKLICQNCL